MKDALIHAVTSAFRERVRGEIRAAPAWHDLDPADRVEAHDATAAQRTLDAALDPRGLSSTAHAVLARLGAP